MRRYRITKYNPFFRNEYGAYLLNEWTSFCDIGKEFNGKVLTEEKYYEIENNYIQAIKYILDDNKILTMRIDQIEKYTTPESDISLSRAEKKFINNLKQGLLIDHNDLEIICKMVLREILWVKLETIDKLLFIEFGYDYYMYVLCKNMDEHTKEKIIAMGLFVEEMDCQN